MPLTDSEVDSRANLLKNSLCRIPVVLPCLTGVEGLCILSKFGTKTAKKEKATCLENLHKDSHTHTHT